ncbi:helix-turn-helix transcriptional regulator [Actinophytocola sp. KF-1]
MVAVTADELGRVTADAGAPAAVVVDVLGLDLLTVRDARELVAFAGECGGRGVDCVLVAPSTGATTVVLDGAGPDGSLPRFATLRDALAHLGADPDAGERGPTLVFDSTDLGRTEEFLSSAYAPMRIASDTGRAGARITRAGMGTVSVDQLDLSFEMSYDVRPLGKVCLCDIVSGDIVDHRVAGWRAAEAFGPGELFSFSPPDRPYEGRIRAAKYSITMFSPALLDEVAGAERPVRLLDHRPHDDHVARRLRAAITHLHDAVLTVPEARDNALVVSTASQYLAACVLTAFPNTATAGDGHADRNDAHPRALRRAIAFIDANADRDITAADIARAAGVSARAVQLAFRRHLGLTPMAYLRRARLDGARADLRAASPRDVTVTQVAARWGFARPSAFAAHYRATYGESPSRTLRGD